MAEYFGAEKQVDVLDGVAYDPATTDFTSTLDTLDAAVAAAQADFPGYLVAVFLAAHDEAVDILLAAQDYAELMDLRWFAGDKVAQNGALLSSAEAAALANSLSLTAVGNGAFGSGTAAVRQDIADHLGDTPHDYGLYAYDAVQILLDAYLALGKDADAADVQAVLPALFENYLGVTGWTLANENGDRAVGSYFLWQVLPDADEELVWTNLGLVTAK